jgi:hypothetical protein
MHIDLVWPNGVQEELSQPAAVLLNEGATFRKTFSRERREPGSRSAGRAWSKQGLARGLTARSVM